MMKPMDVVPIFLAELIGTGLLLFMGCGGCLVWNSQANHLQMVLNFGLVIMIVIQVFGSVSGAHINPAITVTAWINKKVTAPMAVVYVAAQLLGAFMGFGLLKVLTPPRIFERVPVTSPGHCMTQPHEDVTMIQALAIEFIATTVLLLIYCALCDPRNAHTHDSVSLRFGLAVSSLAFTVVSENCFKHPFDHDTSNKLYTNVAIYRDPTPDAV